MKPKVYKIAAMAVAFVALQITAYAQTAAVPPTPALPATTYYQATPATVYTPITTGYGSSAYLNDTAYRNKMQKLQEKMSDLQKQMSTLRTEELKKNGVELGKHMEAQNKVFADAFKHFDKDFGKNFSDHFKNFGQNMNFNFDRTDANWEKKLQSGDVKAKSKTYSKSYTVDADDKLQINNQFGKIMVNTWNKNEFKVDVEIKVYASDDDEAQKLLDQVSIKDSKENSVIDFTTQIGSGSNKSGFWSTGKSGARKTVINYMVYMPAKSALSITNSFGSINLPDLYGKVTINNSNGSLTAKSLSNAANVIKVRYGSANIDNLIGSDLDVTYGSLNLQNADKLNATVSYGSANIGKVNTSGNINIRLGNLQINDVGKSLKNLSVNSSYSPVKLGSLAGLNADFDVSVHMGGFNYDNGINVTSKTPADNSRGWSSTQTYKGHIGKGNSDNLVVIKASYGSVKFDQ